MDRKSVLCTKQRELKVVKSIRDEVASEGVSDERVVVGGWMGGWTTVYLCERGKGTIE